MLLFYLWSQMESTQVLKNIQMSLWHIFPTVLRVYERGNSILHLDINATHFSHFLNTLFGYLIMEKRIAQFFCPSYSIKWVVGRDICCCKIISTKFTVPEEPEDEQAESLGHHEVRDSSTLPLELLPIGRDGELPELRFAWEPLTAVIGPVLGSLAK